VGEDDRQRYRFGFGPLRAFERVLPLNALRPSLGDMRRLAPGVPDPIVVPPGCPGLLRFRREPVCCLFVLAMAQS